MDQKRIEGILAKAQEGTTQEAMKVQEAVRQTRIVFDTLQQQRRGAVQALETKVNQLLNETSKLTKPSLEGEDAGKILANTLRELISAANSAQIALESHDKLLDLFLQDFGKLAMQVQEQSQGTTNGLLHVSVMSEVVMQVLLEKGVFTEDELKETHKKVAESTRSKLSALRDDISNS